MLITTESRLNANGFCSGEFINRNVTEIVQMFPLHEISKSQFSESWRAANMKQFYYPDMD